MRNHATLGAGAVLAILLLLTLILAGAVAVARAGSGVPVLAGTPPARTLAKPGRPAPPLVAAQDGRPRGPQQPLRVGGPDAFGYIVSDSNEPNGPPSGGYIAATHVITGFSGDDERSEERRVGKE